MRARTFREGSVGLLLLLGLGVLGIIFLWLNRVTPGRKTYKAIVEFANAGGMQKGGAVRFRGVKVGNIAAIRPRANNIEVEIEITSADLIIPNNVVVEANQTGLINETVIDITPKAPLPAGAVAAKPLDRNCNPAVIVCNNSRLQGQIGISFDQLIRSSTDLATIYTQPEFYSNVNKVLNNTSTAASSFTELSRNLNVLSKSFQGEISTFSGAATSVSRAANQISASANKSANQLSTTANQLSTTANQFGTTANQFSTTAKDISLAARQGNRLLTNLDTLVSTNRSTLVGALNSISRTSQQLSTTVNSLSPTVNRFNQSKLLQNLETLSTNAAQASANLRDASKTLNDPNNILVLQRTLDSARVTFENTQKITSDLDELTGDPAFRTNLRQLVTGLSNLVSSTQQVNQQVQIATSLESVKASVNQQNPGISPPSTNQQVVLINPAPTAKKTAEKFPPAQSALTPNSSTEQLLQQLREYKELRKQARQPTVEVPRFEATFVEPEGK